MKIWKEIIKKEKDKKLKVEERKRWCRYKIKINKKKGIITEQKIKKNNNESIEEVVEGGRVRGRKTGGMEEEEEGGREGRERERKDEGGRREVERASHPFLKPVDLVSLHCSHHRLYLLSPSLPLPLLPLLSLPIHPLLYLPPSSLLLREIKKERERGSSACFCLV